MDGAFPPNSRRAREAPPEEKKVEKVIEGAVVRRKKPLGKKFGELFVVGDSKSVTQYLILEVVVPAIRDLIVDTVTQGVERSIFGDQRAPSRRSAPTSRYGGPPGYTSYNKPASRQEPRRLSRSARETHNFDEIILPTRREADDVLDRLSDMIEKYDSTTVSDLYMLVGETPNFADENWGWYKEDFARSGVTKVRDGYLLDLPRPVALK
jgi:hypothetical protein